MPHTIDSCNPIYMVFIEFWEPGDISDRDGSHKILTCLDFRTGFGLGAASGMKKITSYQVALWDFVNFFFPFGLPKMIVVDADGLFSRIFKNNLKETLQITVHSVSRRNHKEMRNKGFHGYLKKVHNIHSASKGSLLQWFQGVFFALYAWNAGPVDGTEFFYQ